MSIDVALVAEDVLSLAVMRKLVTHSGRDYQIKRELNEKGIGNVRNALAKYRNASNVLVHFVLVDLDNEVCPVSLRQEWGMLDLPPKMLFRVAIREVESWVLADRDGFAGFCGMASNKIPQSPEMLSDPKQTLLNLVRKSRNRRLIEEIVPVQGTPMSKGPLYNERLMQFVRESWSVDSAIASAPSLKRTVERLAAFQP